MDEEPGEAPERQEDADHPVRSASDVDMLHLLRQRLEEML